MDNLAHKLMRRLNADPSDTAAAIAYGRALERIGQPPARIHQALADAGASPMARLAYLGSTGRGLAYFCGGDGRHTEVRAVDSAITPHKGRGAAIVARFPAHPEKTHRNGYPLGFDAAGMKRGGLGHFLRSINKRFDVRSAEHFLYQAFERHQHEHGDKPHRKLWILFYRGFKRYAAAVSAAFIDPFATVPAECKCFSEAYESAPDWIVSLLG